MIVHLDNVHEQPCRPEMQYDSNDTVYIIVGKMILLQVSLECVAEAVLAFLATLYLLDFDYPKQHEYGLLMLQSITFMDE